MPETDTPPAKKAPKQSAAKGQQVSALIAAVAELSEQIAQLKADRKKDDERIVKISQVVAGKVVEANQAAFMEEMKKQMAARQAEFEAARNIQAPPVPPGASSPTGTPANQGGIGSILNQIIEAAPTLIDAWQKLRPAQTEQEIFRQMEIGFKIHRALDAMKGGDISAFEQIFSRKP